MKKLYALGGVSVVFIAAIVSFVYFRFDGRDERLRYEREETRVIVSNIGDAQVTLFRAGQNLQDTQPLPRTNNEEAWLPKANYFVKIELSGQTLFYPVPIVSYRGGPDKDGAFTVTVRPTTGSPPAIAPDQTNFVFVPSGHFLFGDRQRIQEPHYVWLGGFFINAFEVTNAEFQAFLTNPKGYADDVNWTEAGRKWKASNSSHATARLKPTDPDFNRFGQPDQPVVQVNWFEANAFCRWLTDKAGGGKWIFALPSEAEWEKAARGPDNFDYGLGMNISDDEVKLYNWKKNPSADVTVVGIEETKSAYHANRYGVYHMTGNVAEWTQSIYRSYSRQHPYQDDDDRNHDDVIGERVLRGGSWYTASIAVLNISYRENFRPEVQTPYLGFRVVARQVP